MQEATPAQADPLDLEAIFESFSDDFLKFEDVKKPLHARRDVHAFLLLEMLTPSTGRPLIAGARHDEIWLSTDCDKLAGVITLAQVRDLVRCGIRFDEDALCMFV